LRPEDLESYDKPVSPNVALLIIEAAHRKHEDFIAQRAETMRHMQSLERQLSTLDDEMLRAGQNLRTFSRWARHAVDPSSEGYEDFLNKINSIYSSSRLSPSPRPSSVSDSSDSKSFL
jgi:hypothetical protein